MEEAAGGLQTAYQLILLTHDDVMVHFLNRCGDLLIDLQMNKMVVNCPREVFTSKSCDIITTDRCSILKDRLTESRSMAKVSHDPQSDSKTALTKKHPGDC